MSKRPLSILAYTFLFMFTASVIVWAQQPVTITSGTITLPSGASTAANQSTIITSVQLLDDTVYTEGATDASITGIPALWEDTGDTLRAVSASFPFPVADATVASILGDIRNGLADDGTEDAEAPNTGPMGMGEFDDAAINSVDEDDAGKLRISANRNLYTTLRDAAGNERGVNVTAANELLVELGAGAASIGTLGANSGVDIGDVTLTAGAASIGTLGANSGVDIGDVTLTAGTNLVGRVQLDASTANGADGYRHISVGASEDEHAVKATAGVLYSITVTNVNAAARYLKCENDTAAGTAPGTDVPEIDLAVPGATTGAGFTTAFPMGYTFSTALTCWLVTGAAENDVAEVAANELKVFYTFK